jgi:hypothetical protein
MKKYLLVFALLLSPYLIMAQGERFQINEETPELINQYVVIKKDSMTVEDGYNKTLEWIKITYNTPKEVIKAELENEYIRIEGASNTITRKKMFGIPVFFNGKYSITFEFKENKIKMELTKLQVYSGPSQISDGGWEDCHPDYASQTKKNGKPIKKMVYWNNGYVKTINGLMLGFQYYVNNPDKSIINKDDW